VRRWELWHARLVMLNVEYTLNIQVSKILSQHLQRCSVCDPGQILSTSKFSYLLLRNPTLKTETTNRCRTTNSKPLGPNIMIATDHQSNHIYYSLFGRCKALVCLLPPNGRLVNYAEPKQAYFCFSSSNFTMQDRRLSTAGDALRDKSVSQQDI
jgi:hypothetical protein